MTKRKIEDDHYENDIKYFENKFPDAKFEICIDRDELDFKISDQNPIILKRDRNCYCYKGTPLEGKPQYFVINNSNMTMENVLKEFIKQQPESFCNHCYFEGIENINDTQFKMFFGS